MENTEIKLKSQEQLKRELSAPLPKEAVKPHPTKPYLSSIKAIYVTERLNDVFGIGGWRKKVEEAKVGDKGMIVVKVTIEVPAYGIYFESFGGNDNGGENSKNFDLGDAYKGADTDAITKICSYLEIGIEVFKGQVSAPQHPQAPATPPKQPETKTASYTADIKKKVVESDTLETLQSVWDNNKQLHANEAFKNDVMSRKLALLP